MALTHWPTDYKRINQHFGEDKEYYFSNFGLPGHPGIDIVAPLNAPYYAIADGEVTWISDKIQNDETKPSANGWQILIDHGSNLFAKYCHAQQDIPVDVGQQVLGGQLIGRSGDTGKTTGPHLHLEFQIAGMGVPGYPNNQVDPWPHIEQVFNQITEPKPPLITGWVFKTFTNIVGDFIVTTAQPRVRLGPGSNFEPHIGVLRKGAPLINLNLLQNGYTKIQASIFDFLSIDPSNIP